MVNRFALQRVNFEMFKNILFRMRYIYLACILLMLILVLLDIFVFHKKKGGNSETKGEASAPSPSSGKPMDNGRFSIEIGNCQGTGEREEQQDAFGFSPSSKWKDKGFLAVLCDGMGGLDSGATISNKLVADIIKEFPYSFDELKNGWILDSLSAEIYSEYFGRGGTTVIITYLKGDKLWFASVGDSDLLLLRNGRIYAMNQRQEYGNSLLMRVAEGALSIDQALTHRDAPALTEYMGGKHANPDYSIDPWQVEDNDIYLLCSDGISDTLSFEEIREAMSMGPSRCAELLEQGIMRKNKNYQDNYTAIVFAVHDIRGGI